MAAPTTVMTEARSRALISGLEGLRLNFVLELPSSSLKTIIQHFLDARGVPVRLSE